MIVSSVGLENNPETLVARCRRAAAQRMLFKMVDHLDDMYDDVFNRQVDGKRVPYTFEQVVADLGALGVQVQDWNAQVVSIVGIPNARTVKVRFRSLVQWEAYVTVILKADAVKAFIRDMESSGLWMTEPISVVS